MSEKGLDVLEVNFLGAFSQESAIQKNDREIPIFPASTLPPKGLVLHHPHGADTTEVEGNSSREGTMLVVCKRNSDGKNMLLNEHYVR